MGPPVKGSRRGKGSMSLLFSYSSHSLLGAGFAVDRPADRFGDRHGTGGWWWWGVGGDSSAAATGRRGPRSGVCLEFARRQKMPWQGYTPYEVGAFVFVKPSTCERFVSLPLSGRNCLPPLVDVNVVRPRGSNPRPAGGGTRSGRSTLTSPRLRKGPAATGGGGSTFRHCVPGLAGPTLGRSRLGSRNQAASEAEAGFARWRFSSAIMVRQTWSARRRFRHRLASRSVLPSAILVR